MWLGVGESDKFLFFKAVVDVIRASRIALYTSAVFFLLGVYSALSNVYNLHMYFMTTGLLAFYFSVMYIQLPGFINAVPKRLFTWLLTAFFTSAVVVSHWVGYLAYLPFSLLYTSLYLRGLGRGNTVPNLIHMAGVLLLPTSVSHLEAVASLPLASVYALLYRIDNSRAKRRFSLATSLYVAFAYVVAFVLFKHGVLWSFILPSVVLTLVAPPKLNDVYSAGAFIFRWSTALAVFHHHFMYMAFAVVMAALCVPYFLPSVMYREMPKYGLELFTIAIAAYVLRLLNSPTAAGVLTTAMVIYVVWKLARQRAIPLKPP